MISTELEILIQILYKFQVSTKHYKKLHLLNEIHRAVISYKEL